MSAAPVDVLVITALRAEFDALVNVTAMGKQWSKHDSEPTLHFAVLDGREGPIRVAATQLTRMGGVSGASTASRLIEVTRPRVLAMCGVCAGHPDDTELGDVVIGDRLFQHDEGKVKRDGFQGDVWVDTLRDDWLRVAQGQSGPAIGLHSYGEPGEDDWKWWFLERLIVGRDPLRSAALRLYLPDKVRAQRLHALLQQRLVALKGEAIIITKEGRSEVKSHFLMHRVSAQRLPFQVHVGPIGSGNYLGASGEVWSRFASAGIRKVIAVDMEAAALGRVAHERKIPFIVAKGVTDHADGHKTDHFEDFAARASAEVLCRFLQAVIVPVNAETEAFGDHHGTDIFLNRASPASQLDALLLSMFSVDELRRLLRFLLPGHTHMLPNDASPNDFVSATVDVLLRWALVNANLFAALRNERPRRIAEIDTVARAFGLQDLPRHVATTLVLSPAMYSGPAPRYYRKESELTSQRLLALYAAVERGETGKEHMREIRELHRSLRGEFGELQPGDLLASGRYLLLSARERSSTPGSVWHAYDRRLDQEVALRLFNTTTYDPGFLAYIRSQARATVRLRHPYIAQVFDSSIEDDPHYGYSMDFLRRGHLPDRIAALRGEVKQVVEMTRKLADALAFAHTRGLVHGALEPWGIGFGNDGEPRIRDFGLSISHAEARISLELLPFLAPEIVAGGEPSPIADQYSLARISIACLTGTASPSHMNSTRLARIGVHGRFAAAFQQALHSDPEKRFPNIVEFRNALEGVPTKAALTNGLTSGPKLPRNPAAQLANPFSAGTPLDGTQVPGREEDIDRLLGLVSDRGSALLLGPRRSGKTSLLRHLARALAVEHPVRLISLEAFPCDTPDKLAVALAPELRDVAEPARVFEEQLKQDERWPVLLIDELGYLRNANVKVTPSVFSWLRAVGQESASIIYAASQSDWSQVIAVAKQQPGSSFGNDIVVHELGPLNREAALAFLSLTAPLDAPMPSEPLGAWILEYCGAWPFYLQVMGYSIVDAVRRKSDRRPLRDRKALYELYEACLLRERSHVFEGRWNELDRRVRDLILRKHGRLPDFSALPLPDKKVLRDAGMFDTLNGGWLLDRDPPFFDWIRRKYEELRES